MAKRRGGSTALTRTIYTPAPRPAPQTIKVSMPRAMSAPAKRKGGKRRAGAKHGTGALTMQHMLAFGGAGAALGFIEDKFGSSLPSIPVVGKKGALAILAYFAAKNGMGGGIARDIAVAAAAVAGYQLGKEGKISGDDDE